MRWMSEDSPEFLWLKKSFDRLSCRPVTFFRGDRVLNGPLPLQLSKHFTEYPLLDIKGLIGAPGDDRLLLAVFQCRK